MNTYDSESSETKTQPITTVTDSKTRPSPRMSTIFWGAFVIAVGAVALALIADAAIDATWFVIALISIAGLGVLTLAVTAMRRSSSQNSPT